MAFIQRYSSIKKGGISFIGNTSKVMDNSTEPPVVVTSNQVQTTIRQVVPPRPTVIKYVKVFVCPCQCCSCEQNCVHDGGQNARQNYEQNSGYNGAQNCTRDVMQNGRHDSVRNRGQNDREKGCHDGRQNLGYYGGHNGVQSGRQSGLQNSVSDGGQNFWNNSMASCCRPSFPENLFCDEDSCCRQEQFHNNSNCCK